MKLIDFTDNVKKDGVFKFPHYLDFCGISIILSSNFCIKCFPVFNKSITYVIVPLIRNIFISVFACHAVTGAPNEMGKMDVYSASGRLQLPEVLVATPISVSYKVEVNPTGWRQPAQKVCKYLMLCI